MPANKASSALLSRIAQVALREFGRDDLYVAEAPAGMGLSDIHLDLLQQLEEDRLDNAASVARLVEISRIVDCIQAHPQVIATPDQDPGYLSDVFPQLIKNVEFFSAPLSGSERQRYEQAQKILFEAPPFLKTPVYQEFCILRAELEKKDVALAEMRRDLQDRQSPEERRMLESEIEGLNQLMVEKREALEAIDRCHGFRDAEEIVDNAERRIDDIPASIRSVLDTMELFQITDPISNVTHVSCSFFPSHLAEDNWTPLKLTREDIARSEGEDDNTTSDPDEIDDREIDTIELEVQTVVCERPWLWPALFENRRWDWAAPSPPISTGNEGGSEEDLIPAYIHALIFARNLTVKAQLSTELPRNREAVKVRPTSSLLMRAVTPVVTEPRRHVTTIARHFTADNVTPLISRNMVMPAIVRAHPVGPAVARQPSRTARFSRVGVAIVRPGIIRNLAAKGCVVDEHGRGIYKATVRLESNAGQRRTMTGRDGGFTFPTIAQGRYRVHVEKAGFTPVNGAITVPQTTPQTIRMSQAVSCQVMVRLQLDGGQPFVGDVKVLIQNGNGRRLESMDERSEAIFSLPPGSFTISVTSPQAEQISPPSRTIRLSADRGKHPTLTFTVSPAPMLRNPKVQLLGYVIRRVQCSPNPERR